MPCRIVDLCNIVFLPQFFLIRFPAIYFCSSTYISTTYSKVWCVFIMYVQMEEPRTFTFNFSYFYLTCGNAKEVSYYVCRSYYWRWIHMFAIAPH